MAEELYCELDDVKRVLRSIGNKESRVKFSLSYRELGADQNNQGTIRLSGVVFEESFSDHEQFTFEFSDSTSFEVIGEAVGYIGIGTTQATFTAVDRFIVASSRWSGLAAVNDKVYITANSDISDDDGIEFIKDATKKINAFLERSFGSLSNVSFYDGSEDVPDAINIACIKLAAYEIFTSIYAGATVDEESIVAEWKKDSQILLDEYILGHGSGPIWRSRDSRITEIGVVGVGEGIIEIDNLTDPGNANYKR